MNHLSWIISSLIPLIVGSVWYSRFAFGNVWIKEKTKGWRMIVVVLLTILFSYFISTALRSLVVHQVGVDSLLGGNDPLPSYHAFMNDYGGLFRTFKHGVLHGVFAGISFALPIVAISALFERKSWKYILIHACYWTLSLALMGGVLCAWS